MNNQRGQISVSAVILIPLLVLVVGAILILGLALSIEARATAACRLRMAKNQTDAAIALAELTKLNPKAHALETTRQAALKAVKTAAAFPNPAARAAALATLRTVELSQAPIRKLQTYWINRGKLASKLAPHEAKLAVVSSIPASIRPWVVLKRAQAKAPQFALVSSSPLHLTPTYLPAPGFQTSQNGVLKWKNTIRNPNRAAFKFTDILPELELGCSMSLEPATKERWAPQPTEDKLSSNSSSS